MTGVFMWYSEKSSCSRRWNSQPSPFIFNQKPPHYQVVPGSIRLYLRSRRILSVSLCGTHTHMSREQRKTHTFMPFFSILLPFIPGQQGAVGSQIRSPGAKSKHSLTSWPEAGQRSVLVLVLCRGSHGKEVMWAQGELPHRKAQEISHLSADMSQVGIEPMTFCEVAVHPFLINNTVL